VGVFFVPADGVKSNWITRFAAEFQIGGGIDAITVVASLTITLRPRRELRRMAH
jgi:hypothetical protein